MLQTYIFYFHHVEHQNGKNEKQENKRGQDEDIKHDWPVTSYILV